MATSLADALPSTAVRRTLVRRRAKLGLLLLACLSLPWLVGSNLFRIVDGASMDPTLHRGNVIAIIPSALHRRVRRGDIVVLQTTWEPGLTVIKRVAGVEGDCVLQVSISSESVDSPCVEVRPGHLFVVGDNPSRSSDSRQNGQVPASAVMGVAKCVLWPVKAMQCGTPSTSRMPELR